MPLFTRSTSAGVQESNSLTEAEEMLDLALSLFNDATAKLNGRINATEEAKKVFEEAVEYEEMATLNHKRRAEDLKEAKENVKKIKEAAAFERSQAFRALVKEKGCYTVVSPGDLGGKSGSDLEDGGIASHSPDHTPPQSPRSPRYSPRSPRYSSQSPCYSPWDPDAE